MARALWLTFTLATLLLTACGGAGGNAATDDDALPSPVAANTTDAAGGLVSAWGEPVILGTAARTAAPVMVAHSGDILATWSFDDATGVHHRLHSSTEGHVDLSLLARYPTTQTLLPAAPGRQHMIWLDADPDAPRAGRRLWSALLDGRGTTLHVSRGAFILSDEPTYQVTALPTLGETLSGGAWVVWSHGPADEPNLSSHYLDSGGRPRPYDVLLRGAHWPVLLRDAAGTPWLVWLDAQSGAAYRAPYADGDLLALPHQVAQAPPLPQGTALQGFSAAADATHLYLVWQVKPVAQAPYTLLAAYPLADAAVPPVPALRLGVAVSSGTVASDYPGVQATRVTPGERSVGWHALADTDAGVLMTAQIEQTLVLLLLRDGGVVGLQSLVELDEPGLLGPPSITADAESRVSIAWAEPAPDGAATLYRITAP